MKTQTKMNTNQLSFDFWTASPKSLGAMARAMLAPTPHPAVVNLTRTSVELGGVVAVPNPANATLVGGPGSENRRVLFVRDVEHGRCQIQFPGDTYANGEPRIQTFNRGVIVRDGEGERPF